MKTKIIPAINAQTFEEIKTKINILKDLTLNFHLDVAERKFTGYETWQNYNDLDRLTLEGTNNSISGELSKNNISDHLFKLIFDLHLMIYMKPQEILKWAKENVKRFILHLEATTNPDGFLKLAKKTKKEIFIAWSPKIAFDFIQKYLNFVNGILVLGVNPGRAGQNFLEDTYSRLALIKKNLKKNQKLMIDGGVNQQNLKQILVYKPDFIVMASAIYNDEDPRKRYLEFMKLINTA